MWFCLQNNANYGPFSDQEVRLFVLKNPDCLVWQEGMAEWVKASQFNLFKDTSIAPPSSNQALMTSLDFKIYGDDMQYVEIALEPDESILAEPGSMVFKETGVEFEALLGNGRNQGFFGKLFGAGKRVLTGERAFISSFTNILSNKKQRVAFCAPYPGKLIPVSLKSFGGEIICQKESFLCAELDVEIGIFFQKRIFTAFFGGAGFIMQRLTGNGVVFIHAGGTICEIDLDKNKSIQVDAGCLVAFQPTVSFDISDAGGLKSQLFGGAGLFFAELTGPGKVWVQSLPFSRLARRILATPDAKRVVQRQVRMK